MKIQALTGRIEVYVADAILIYLLEDQEEGHPRRSTRAVDEALKGQLSELIKAGDFSGKLGQTLVLYPGDTIPAKRVIVTGLGKLDDFSVDSVRRAVATAVQKARDLNCSNVATTIPGTGRGGLSIDVAARAVAEGAVMGLYRYTGQKSNSGDNKTVKVLDVIAGEDADLDAVSKAMFVGETFANGSRLARELANLPPNICTPAYLAESAQEIATTYGLSINVLEREQMRALRMGALLAVAQGSDTPPRFIVLEHNADKADSMETLILVGKGVTFDTGGYSLKPRDGMIGMKGDMGGAAAVLGAMQIVGALDLPVHVVGLVPTADNMINGSAYRPQDVVTASNGKTIEIISTDAEGRMLLADALVYAQRYNPAAVVDIATLTGGAVIALGSAAAALFSRDEDLRGQLRAAGHSTQERVWLMPLYPEYQKQIESDTADIKNSGGREASSATAAAFLSHFIDYNWAHVDMAGVMSSDGSNPTVPGKGMSGYGARLLAEWVRQRAGASA